MKLDLLLLFLTPVFTVLAEPLPHGSLENGGFIVGRQGGPGPGQSSKPGDVTSSLTSTSETPTTPTTTATSSAQPTTTQQPTSSSSPSTTSPTSSPSSSSSSSPPSSTSVASSTTPRALTTSSSPPTTTAPSVTTVTSSVSNSQSTTTTSSSPSSTSTGSSDSGGLGKSTIIALSVAGAVGALAILGFIIWKLKRKRFSDFDDDDNAIKWPDLDGAAAMHPLPARPTGRAGVETSALDRSENDAFDSRSFAENSLTNLVHPAPAPYSLPAPDVPPSQQYHDDPAAFGGQYPQQPEGYYDPYRGPVPKSMTLPPEDQYGRKSPGPYNAYEGGRTGSPGPQPPYGGGIGVGRVPSPGPQAAYAGRTPSPGPQNAYGSGIPRTTSPGPYGAFDEDPYGGTDQHTMEQHHQQQTQGRNENFGSAG